MGLISEENFDGSHMTKRNYSNASVGRDVSDTTSTTIVITSNTYTAIIKYQTLTTKEITQVYFERLRILQNPIIDIWSQELEPGVYDKYVKNFGKEIRLRNIEVNHSVCGKLSLDSNITHIQQALIDFNLRTSRPSPSNINLEDPILYRSQLQQSIDLNHVNFLNRNLIIQLVNPNLLHIPLLNLSLKLKSYTNLEFYTDGSLVREDDIPTMGYGWIFSSDLTTNITLRSE
ncbi:19707_t:CDS:2 [Rhizophagus irregularis]|nr:19707_t:CDS:2 [Rhizophagus irregularis]